jgi:gliding motility associated protien GldN
MKKLSILLCCGITCFCSLATIAQSLPVIDGIVKRNLINERQPLAYEPVREADILWEKKVWRVIDVREKINLSFVNPEQPFFSILNKAVLEGKIPAYSTENDKFSTVFAPEEVMKIITSSDTIEVFDEDGNSKSVSVTNEINWENVRQFRIKEAWYFDKKTSRMEVRILGIAPLLEEYDENGNFKFIRPLYWVYYPNCRDLLAKERFRSVAENDANPTSWEDAIEMRMFSSYITKESNIYDRRLEDYLSGVDLLLEGDKLKHTIFNYEQDMWSF